MDFSMMAKGDAMKVLVMAAALAVVAAGCGSTSISRAVNRDNLNKLQVDMAKSQVQGIMGKPYKKTTAEGREVWYYDTGLRQNEQGDHHETFTRLFFEQGKLVKWGKPDTIELRLE